jgi:hypothetical protein
MHKRFEELCALAVTGQVTSEGKAMLEEHARGCDECRGFLLDMGPLKDHLAPAVAGNRVRLIDPPEGVRQRFLQRAAAAGMNIQAGPPLVAGFPEIGVPNRATLREILSAVQGRMGKWHPFNLRFAWSLAAASICVMAGYTLAHWQSKGNVASPVNVVAVSQTPAALPDSSAAIIVSRLQQQKKEADERLGVISGELARAQAEELGMTRELAVLKQQVAAGAESQQQLEQEKQKAQRTATLVDSLQAELEAARKKQVDLDVILTAQQDAAQDATARLARMQAELASGGDNGLAKSQAEEIISARNLHIVDVYDADGKGKRQNAFGRVFYVEGRSLAFYAYDLDRPSRYNANIIFHVWGGVAGVKAVTHNLGILHKDDAADGSWAMTFDDPKVLAHINCVFVTAEARDKHYTEPHGKKILYAYFGGQANHP